MLLSCATKMVAQDNEKLIWRDQVAIDEFRYEGVKGSPYLFEEFVPARLYDKNRLILEDVLINFNGETQEFESINNGIKSELDKTFYIKMDIYSDLYDKDFNNNMSDTTHFVRAINPKDLKEFYILVHGGRDVTVFKKFEVKINTRKVENVGETIEFKNFSPMFYYWMVRNGQAIPIRLNKKSVLLAMDAGKQVNSYVKNKKLKIKSEAELLEVIRYHEQILSNN